MTAGSRLAQVLWRYGATCAMKGPMKPPLVTADPQGASVREVYQPVDLGLLAEIADVLDDLARNAPDVLAAVEDVDRTLIWEAMVEDPITRLARSAQQARFYARWKALGGTTVDVGSR